MKPINPKLRRVLAVSLAVVSAVVISGCQSGSSTHVAKKEERIKSDPNEAFSSKEYGVAASPRVTDLKTVRKGGGRAQVGKPYKVRGKWYYPKEVAAGHSKSGKASWYGSSFHGRLTANGEIYDMFGLSAAHPTFPLPSYAKVTNLKNGSSVMVRVNDRGPYAHGRVMDLSSKAADMLGYKQAGIGDVKVEYVGKAPVDGDDTPMLMATYRPGNASPIDDGLASGVMIAMNDTPPQTPSASGYASTAAPNLPGVRPLDAIGTATPSSRSEGSLFETDGMSVGSIIDGTSAPAVAPIPQPRMDPIASIVASYAPTMPLGGAAAALSSLDIDGVAGAGNERIEIGLVSDPLLIEAIREIAGSNGRLIVDAGVPEIKGSSSLSVEIAPGANADTMLQALWQAGATDAFVLRD